MLKEITKRHKGRSALLVLRPVALGVLRCALEGAPIEQLWQHVNSGFMWDSYEMEGRKL